MDEQLERYRAAYEPEPWHESDARMDRTFRRLMRGLGAIVLIIAIGLIWSVRDAKAQGMCMPLAALDKILSERFGEKPVGGGVAPTGKAAIQVYASAGGKTFSIVIAGTSGTACIVAVGRDWENGEIEPAGRES